MGRILNKYRRTRARLTSKLHRPPAGVRIIFVPPSYWLVDKLNAESVIVDMGLGNNADFSMAMIERFGVIAHGFDPTRRHIPALKLLATASNGHFIFREMAIGPKTGSAKFYESQVNVSGSMMTSHKNIRRDATVEYEVQVITLEDALGMAGPKVDLVKMDIEGAEEEVLDGCSDELLKSVDQWCIEFHHAKVGSSTYANTRRYIRRFTKIEYRVFSQDDTNFLFYRASLGTG